MPESAPSEIRVRFFLALLFSSLAILFFVEPHVGLACVYISPLALGGSKPKLAAICMFGAAQEFAYFFPVSPMVSLLWAVGNFISCITLFKELTRGTHN